MIARTRTNSAYDRMLPGAATDDYISNGLNQYEVVDGVTVAYDDNGNMTTDHRGQQYTYAANNMLRQVRDSASTLLANYVYSGEGLVRYRSTPSTSAYLFHDGDQEIMESSSGYASPTADRRYIRLPGSVDEVLLMIDYVSSGCSSGCKVYAHADRQGSTVATSDENGDLIDTYSYSVYGENGEEGGFPFRYTGQKFDADTGLYYYKARFYDPEVGRFLQTDPIGYGDGTNMYQYAGGDPVNRVDPMGLFRTCIINGYYQNSYTSSGNDFTVTASFVPTGSACWDTGHGFDGPEPFFGPEAFGGPAPEGGQSEEEGDENDSENCAILRYYVQNYASPDQIEAIVDGAVASTGIEYVWGGSGTNVPEQTRYTLTGAGWVDLQHVVSAGNSPLTFLGLAGPAGGIVERAQQVSPSRRHRQSAMLPSDFRSNGIGQNSGLLATVTPLSLGQWAGVEIANLGALSQTEAASKVERQCNEN